METMSNGSEDISEIHAWRLALEADAQLDTDRRCNSPPHFPHKGVGISPPSPTSFVTQGQEGDAHRVYYNSGMVGLPTHECATSPSHRMQHSQPYMQHPQPYLMNSAMMKALGDMNGPTGPPMQREPPQHHFGYLAVHSVANATQVDSASPTQHQLQYLQKGAESVPNAMYAMNVGCNRGPLQQQGDPAGMCAVSASRGCDSPLVQHHDDGEELNESPRSIYFENDLHSPTHRLYDEKGRVTNEMYDAHHNSRCESQNTREQHGARDMMPAGMCDANQMSRSESSLKPCVSWSMMPQGMRDPHQSTVCESSEQQHVYTGNGIAPIGLYNINSAGCSSPVHQQQQQQCTHKNMHNMASSEMCALNNDGCHSPTHHQQHQQHQHGVQKTMDALPTGVFVNNACNSSPPLHFQNGMTLMPVDPYSAPQAHVTPLPVPTMMPFHAGPAGQYQPNNPHANYAPPPHPLILPSPGPFHALPFPVNRPNGLEMGSGEAYRGSVLPQVQQQVGSCAIDMRPPASYFLDSSGAAAYSLPSEQFPSAVAMQHHAPLGMQRANAVNMVQTRPVSDNRNRSNVINDMPPLFESEEEYSEDFALDSHSETVVFDTIPHFWGEKEIREMCAYHGVQSNKIDCINLLPNSTGDTQRCFINFFDRHVAQEFRTRIAKGTAGEVLPNKSDAQKQKDDEQNEERVPSKILSLSAELAKERTTISISNMLGTPTIEAPTSSQDESGNPQEHNSVRKKKKASKAKKRARLTSTDSNDGMTTVMMRNIPNKYTPEELLSEFEAKGFLGTFNFMYLPMDFCNRVNLGYCFLNFIRSETIDHFTKAFTGAQLQRYVTRKVIEVFPAETQGFDKNVQKFLRGESKRIQNPWFRPMVFREHEGKCVCLPLREKTLELFYDDASLTQSSSMWVAANDPSQSHLS